MPSTRSTSPRLITLGRLALLDADGSAMVSPDSGKLLAVLAYLAAVPGRRATREQLIDLFWADSPAVKARNALRQLIHKLREVLGDDMIPHGGNDDVCLVGSLATDRDEFLAALGAGDLEPAIATYGGPYAPGMVSAGSAGFEQWADRERETLQDLFTGACDALGRRTLAAGDPRRAQAVAQRLIDVDPLNERAWRLRLEAEFAAGTRIHLAASIAELRRNADAAGRPLEPRTMRLLETLSGEPPDPGTESSEPSVIADLVGREVEFARLYAGWHQVARSRRGSHQHVVGAAGLGKTRCLADFAIRLRTERVRVVAVRTTPRQRDLPDSCLAALVAALVELPGAAGVSERSARLLVDLQPSVAGHFAEASPLEVADPVERRRARTEALNDLVSAITDDAPLALLLDDAHWWDASSREIIADLIERVEHRPVLFVTASRPGPAELSTSLSAAPIVLKPLSPDEIAAMIRSVGESADAAAISWLAARLRSATDGVPLYVLEALRLGLDRGLLGLQDGRWQFDQLPEFLISLRPGGMLADRIASLSQAQRAILLLVAVIERPVDVAMATATGVETPGAALLELERMGMITARGDSWVVAHDAIAQATIDAASEPALQCAHALAGTLLLSRATTETGLAEAARHLLDGESSEQLNAACGGWVERRRNAGDPREGAAIISDLLGPAVRPAVIDRIAATLPRRLRHRRRAVNLAWPIGGLIGAAAIALAWWITSPPDRPDETLGVLTIAANGTRQLDVPIFRRSWEANRQLATNRTDGLVRRFPGRDSALVGVPVASPDLRQWLTVRQVKNAFGPTEIGLINAAGVEHPLSPAPGDDVSPDWSPDGASVVFATTRWSPAGDVIFSLAIFDLARRRVRQLTSGGAGDERPNWSPDGTRIAFTRRPVIPGPNQLCWISVDGRRSHCQVLGQEDVEVIGWRDNASLVARIQPDSGDASLARIRVDDGIVRTLVSGEITSTVLSPDGRWAACNCRFSGMPRTAGQISVFPINQPDQRRPVIVDPEPGPAKFFWYGGAGRRYLARIRIPAPTRPIATDASYQMSVRGTLADSSEILPPPAVLEWESSDTVVVTVDTLTGYLHPRSPGVAWIRVSAGGWQRDSAKVRIVGAASTSMTTERWDRSWQSRWLLFGSAPLPDVLPSTALGRALTPNGDGTYDNGVFTRQRYWALDGLGVEAVIAAPLNSIKWQRVGLTLGEIDPIAAGVPSGIGCVTGFPSGESWAASHVLNGPELQVRLPDALRTGQAFRLRVQLFPDGTCGVAVDGQPVMRSAGRFPLDRTYGVIVRGESVGTHILVGPLTIWTGVRDDVNWEGINPGVSAARGAVGTGRAGLHH